MPTRESRPWTLLKPSTRKPNFAVHVLIVSVRIFVILLLVAGVAGIGVLLGIVKAYTETAPELNLHQIDEQAQTSFFYDPDGNVITDYKGTEDRVNVSIDQIPEMLQYAFVAIEDARFYTHNGIDIKRIVGAFVSNMSSSSTQGGSTITQQLLKNSILSDEQSYKRKIQEAYLALQLENIYSKDQILESYLNTLYLGESYYGVKTAASGYFGKELSELTLRECAMLAGVAQSPYYYNPRRNFYTRQTPKVTDDRTDYALRCMYENQFITHDQYQAALSKDTVHVLEQSPHSNALLYEYPYYVEYAVQDVVSELIKYYSLEDTRENRNRMEQRLRTGGYHVTLCIDTQIQRIVEDTLATFKDYPRLRDPNDEIFRQRNIDGTFAEIIQPQAAAVIVDYRTGEVKAVVGGRTAPTARKTLNRATDMKMPVGSAIKPIAVYAPAIEMGRSPASIVYNMPVPIHGWNDGTGRDYYPSNYGGGGFTGPTTFRRAMRQSFNTGAAQALLYYVGVDQSAEFLREMGVRDDNIQKTAFGLALGSSGITPMQMAVSFGTIANGGVYQAPMAFSRIEDSNGNMIIDRRTTQERKQIFRQGTAWMTVDMMKDVISNGTGTSAKIRGQTVAGKTGTNSEYKGITFSGMTGWYVGSVWIGHDNYKALTSKATGGNFAAPLWQSIMEQIHTQKGLPDREIIEKTPEELGLVRVTTCGASGLIATDACRSDAKGISTVTDYWNGDAVPRDDCSMHQQLVLCADTGMLATEYCSNRSQRSAVIIPYGHPLYDFIDQYPDPMRSYLGEFAALKLTPDPNYNAQLIQSVTCSLHTQGWVQEEQQWQQSGAYDEVYDLIRLGYDLLMSRGAELTSEQYVSVSYCIRQVEAILDSGNFAGLSDAMSNLRYALQVF